MTSFEIADPGPTMTPTPGTVAGKAQVEGRVTFVVRNTTGLNRSAKVTLIAGAEDLPCLTLVGAAPTDPSVRYIDFAANQVQNVEVAAAAPLGAAARQLSLRIRATLDGDSDYDSIDSRPVILDVPAQTAEVPKPPPQPSRFPLWAILACVALVVAVGGVAAFVLWPKPVQVPDFRNHPLREVANWFKAQNGKVTGQLVPAFNPNAPSEPSISDQTKVGTTGGVDQYRFTVSFGPPANNPCLGLVLLPAVKMQCLQTMQPLALAQIRPMLQGSNLNF